MEKTQFFSRARPLVFTGVVLGLSAALFFTAAANVPQYSLELTREGTGSGTVTSDDGQIACGTACSHVYENQTFVTLTALPVESTSLFIGWTGDCGVVYQNLCRVNVDTVKNVKANFMADPAKIFFAVHVNLEGIGIVKSDVSGINCGTVEPTGSVCTKEFPIGRTIALTAFQRPGSTAVFSRWSGGCLNVQENICTVFLDTNKTVTASFAYPPLQTAHPLQVRIEGNGKVVSDDKVLFCTYFPTADTGCSRAYIYGSLVTLIATPEVGSTFVEWQGNCIASFENLCRVKIEDTTNITAKFQEKPQLHQLSVVPVGGGTVRSNLAGIDCGSDCAEQYLKKTTVSLSANPGQGSVFNGWGGACSGKGLCSVTMDSQKFVYAFFGASSPMLTVFKNGSGVVESNPAGILCGNACSSSFPAGTAVSLTAVPAAGYQFVGWGGYGGCLGKNPTCAFQLRMRKQVVANFKKVSP